MIKIGSHVSISGGLLGAAQEAKQYGANIFMVYTGAPQNTVRQPLDKMKIEEGRAYMKENGLTDVIVHAPYLINLGSYKDNIYTLAKSFLKDELKRAHAFGAEYMVLHPGAYTDKDLAFGTDRIITGLNEILSEELPVICLETMAGKGTEIGRSFEELAAIIDGVKLKHKIAVCFDTCHTHDAGYDIIENLDGVLKEFDRILGLDLIKVIHVNGSLNSRGAHKDRHANIGAGEDNVKGSDKIGALALHQLVHHPLLADRLFILETPWLDKKTNLYQQEIALLRRERLEV